MGGRPEVTPEIARAEGWYTPNPSGLCMCGCGGKTAIAERSLRSEKCVRGEHKRYLPGHGAKERVVPRGPASPYWKGDKIITEQGYVSVHDPRSKNSRGLEHRLVAEQELGREVRPGEHVHHINGDRTDNRPINLRVMTVGDHRRLHSFHPGLRAIEAHLVNNSEREVHVVAVTADAPLDDSAVFDVLASRVPEELLD